MEGVLRPHLPFNNFAISYTIITNHRIVRGFSNNILTMNYTGDFDFRSKFISIKSFNIAHSHKNPNLNFFARIIWYTVSDRIDHPQQWIISNIVSNLRCTKIEDVLYLSENWNNRGICLAFDRIAIYASVSRAAAITIKISTQKPLFLLVRPFFFGCLFTCYVDFFQWPPSPRELNSRFFVVFAVRKTLSDPIVHKTFIDDDVT